jgi:Major Facilitator Superfamily
MIMLALFLTMITGVLFGFSKSLAWAMAARGAQGLCNGNVGIIRTAVAELVPERELQPRAFSIMPLVWTIGSIFGPAFGGSLVHPVERFPALFKHSRLFADYPFALPNILISSLFCIGIFSGILFLQETLADKKSKKDYGLILGELLTGSCRKRKPNRWRADIDDAATPFLRSTTSSEMSTPTGKKPSQPLPRQRTGWAQVFTRQSNINLAVYTFLAMHSVAYDQLLPIFMHHPVQSIQDPSVHLPLKFAGGFGIGSGRIGVLFMVYGIYGMVIQFAVFPVLARKYGVLNCLKGCAIVFPMVYIAQPFTALLPTSDLRQGVALALMLVKGFCSIFSFPCSTILLTNSASSLKILGTLNGVATSISAIGRAAGPAMAGALFTSGVDLGYVIISFWFLACIAVVAAVPMWWLVEMEGFSASGSAEDADEESEEESEEEEDAKATSSEVHDGLGDRLRKAPQHTSLGVPEEVFDEPDDVPEDSAFLTRTNTTDSRGAGASGRSRRTSLDFRRVPSPIGLGPHGIAGGRSRRYSSDLGATRSGFGTGGGSFN